MRRRSESERGIFGLQRGQMIIDIWLNTGYGKEGKGVEVFGGVGRGPGRGGGGGGVKKKRRGKDASTQQV